MNRKKIVAGNWKMNMDQAGAMDLVKAVMNGSKAQKGVERVVFPPFPFLKSVSDLLAGEEHFFAGAQDCSEHEKGAYTGEVSAEMLRSVGCKYVIVGHSERRQYFKETSAQLIAKIDRAVSNGLSVIFCFGESLDERKNKNYESAVKKQLIEVLTKYSFDKTGQLVLAYEPVWAIGTGETATPQQAQDMHAFVRRTIEEEFMYPGFGDHISILYGGSCNAQNASELFACPDVDGGLIGGASLKADDFCKIINSFS